MGYGFHKRISRLRRQSDESLQGRLHLFRTVVFVVVAFSALFYLFDIGPSEEGKDRQLFSDKRDSYSGQSVDSETADLLARLNDSVEISVDEPRIDSNLALTWQQRTENEVSGRVDWLDNSLFGSGVADQYLSFSRHVVNFFVSSESSSNIEDGSMSVRGWFHEFKQGLASAFLRVGFVVIPLWLVWIILAVVGYGVALFFVKEKLGSDILGICRPSDKPFYSGIYGPLRPNHSFSGTDYSCPGLACPKQTGRAVAQAHPLGQMLKTYGALNETNLALVQMVVACKEFPSAVPEERSADDIVDSSAEEQDSMSGLVRQTGRTLEQNTERSLKAVLQAHQALVKYSSLFAQAAAKASKELSVQEKFRFHLRALEKLSKDISPLGGVLLRSLTPDRARALGMFPISAVASGVLALEAGKTLVFKPVKGSPGAYEVKSQFPHLQARAVMHSVPSYHTDYDGDTRLQIRQAIVCSRRHGDFGRAFLPINMPVASRALRDWLETIYALDSVQEQTAYLSELDGHIEEIHNNWRVEYARRLEDQKTREEKISSSKDATPSDSSIWKGVSFKSVILIPLSSVADIALTGISQARQDRVMALIEETRQIQSRLSISARLPGFKRQAVEATKDGIDSGGITKLLAESESGHNIANRWLIIRRMLTQYNWLSTRIGDDAVPVDGLVHAVVVMRGLVDEKPEVAGLDALVPLRQRRLKALFGNDWERSFYHDSPHDDDIEVFVDNEAFKNSFAIKMKHAEQGLLSNLDIANAVSA